MNPFDWLRQALTGQPQPAPDPDKVTLTARQLDLAGRLARMKGVSRDEVLAEAYRRADKILSGGRK